MGAVSRRIQLAGLHEVAEILGVSRQRADQLARQAGFPQPLDEIRAGRIWRRADIERWAEARRTGCPRKSA